jgi:hypothetical protein
VRKVKGFVLSILLFTGLVCGVKVQALHGAQALSVDGQAQVQLQFRITIPQILSLQIGQEGNAIDTIGFTLTDLPGTGRVTGDPQRIPVKAVGLVPRGQTVALTVDSASPLSNGAQVIPFTNISWQATGDFPAGGFSGRPNQKVGQWNGPGDRQGYYSFSYQNLNYFPPGTYVGRVVYTLSTP